MRNNKYILAENSKAVAHFKEMGVKLTPAKKQYLAWGWYDYGEEVICAVSDIFYVDVDMSGNAFHRYLLENGLLMRKHRA